MSFDKSKILDNRDKARALTEREKARDVSVWFQSKANFIHPLKELIANGTDEINNNFDNGTITVKLHEDLKTITINDSGRGIPLEAKTDDGVPYYKLFLLVLFAGTNYDNEENGKVTTGQHGLGLTLTNYCSTYFKIESYRKEIKSSMEFINGGDIKQDFTIEKNIENKTGTIITFKLDEEIFGDYKYNPEEIKNILNKLSGCNNKIKMIFLHGGESIKYHYDSIEEYFDTITSSNTSKKIIGKEKEFIVDGKFYRYNLVMCSSSEPTQESFLNITYLSKGGTINDGIIKGVKTYINKYCKTNKLLNNKTGSITDQDIEDSISFVCNVMSVKAEFANQTKLSTENPLYETLSAQYVKELLELYEIEQPKEFNKLVKHILEVQKFNNKSDNNKKALKKKLSEKIDGVNNRVEDLIDCEIHGEDAELYIAEGKSALGSVVLARDSKFQAAIPIRGKILNCLKANYDTIFKNTIILDLVKVIGTGIETDKKNKDLDTFNIKNLRYGKIIFTADQDADGEAIVCLLLTMVNRLMPTLIKEGKVYIAQTPLYEVKLKDDSVIYWYSEDEKNREIGKYNNIVLINRAKGLGELEPEIMAESAMNPETRNLIQVTIDDVQKMQEAFEVWMDTNPSQRKEYIEDNLDRYINDID